MFVLDDFNWDGLVAVDRLMAQVLVGSYLALSGVVCFNLYIALLSKTFTDAYGQAQATALMQQATVIISVEKNLPKKQKIKFGHYMQNECSPLEIYTLTEGHTPKDQHNMLFNKIVRQSSNRILEFEECLQKNLKRITPYDKRFAGRKGHGGKGGMNKDDSDQDSDGDGKYVKVAAILPLLDEHTQRLEELEDMLSEFKKAIREELGELPKSKDNKKFIGSLLGKFKSSVSKSPAEKEGHTSDPGTGSAGNGILGRWGSKKGQGQQRSKYSANDLDPGRHEEEIDVIDGLKAKARNLLGIDSYSPENAEAASGKRAKRKPSGKINRGYEEEGKEVNRRRRRNSKGQRRAITRYDDNKEESSEYEEAEESTIKTWLRQKLQ